MPGTEPWLCSVSPHPFPYVLTEIGLVAICTSVWKQAKCQPSHGFHTEESSGRPLVSHPDCGGSGLAVLMNVLTLGSHELGKHFCHRRSQGNLQHQHIFHKPWRGASSVYTKNSPHHTCMDRLEVNIWSKPLKWQRLNMCWLVLREIREQKGEKGDNK